jgi:hypothetical protein
LVNIVIFSWIPAKPILGLLKLGILAALMFSNDMSRRLTTGSKDFLEVIAHFFNANH